MISVNDMFKSSQANNTPLLSNFNADFWNDYVSHYDEYDSVFNRMFYSFRYFLQEDGETSQTVRIRFTKDVSNHLRINSKKYSELFKINVVTDNSLLADFKHIEIMDRDTTDSYGAVNETDSVNSTISKGERNETITDSSTIVKGSKTDTVSGTGSYVKGAREDTTDTTIGSQNNINTNQVAPYDTETFFNEGKTSTTLGNRSDTVTLDVGAQTDTSSDSITNNYGSSTDTNNSSKTNKFNAYQDGETTAKSHTETAHTDTHTEDYTLTKEGYNTNPNKLLNEQKKFWSVFEFYEYIFKQISKELLLV